MKIQLTAVFQKVPEGYIGFVEELPGANTQADTLEEARVNIDMDSKAAIHRVLLNDDQVSRFITDGYLVLDSGVLEDVNQAIYKRLQYVLHEEGNPGNNILPAVPELQNVLDSPTVRGALESILGQNYILHPHRYCHNNEPGERTSEGERVGKGSHSFIGWHQDDHSPLSQPRHHYPRYAMILYYPQDTPVEMGPTQIIPATHLHRSLSDTDRMRGFQTSGPAGTCVLVQFDLAHGGSLNLSDHTRHMVKFVFARAEEPTTSSWNCSRIAWETPPDHQSPTDSTVVWSHLWNWMSGRGRISSSRVSEASLPKSQEEPNVILKLINSMNCEEAVRQNAIYSLAEIGETAVGPLIENLLLQDTNRWSEGATVMENAAYTLAAIGAPAIPALRDLLHLENEWIRINAIFALGEMGKMARSSSADLIACLADSSHAVVRTALNAIGQIGAEESEALPAIQKLLLEDNPEWETSIMREWSAQDQVRMNAMMALLRLGWKSEDTTQVIIKSLNDSCGYVTGFGSECLLRQNTDSSLSAAIAALCTHRWDNTLRIGVRTY